MKILKIGIAFFKEKWRFCEG